eukprot:g14729.t1
MCSGSSVWPHRLASCAAMALLLMASVLGMRLAKIAINPEVVLLRRQIEPQIKALLANPNDAGVKAAIGQALNDSGLPDAMLFLGDSRSGHSLGTWQKGTQVGWDSPLWVASASKLLTAALLLFALEQQPFLTQPNATLSLSTAVGEVLPWWTAVDANDQRSKITLGQLLSFTSGLAIPSRRHDCAMDKHTSLEQCVRQIHQDGLIASPGVQYNYGSPHMQVAGYVVQVSSGRTLGDWLALFLARVQNVTGEEWAGRPVTWFDRASDSNPFLAGGATSTLAEYSAIMTALVAKGLLSPDSLAALAADQTVNASFGYRPDVVDQVGDWHYGLGCWLECESAEWTAAENPICGPGGSEQVISSLGAWGFYPFWAISAGYYGVLAQSTLQARLGLFVAALVCACLSCCSCCLASCFYWRQQRRLAQLLQKADVRLGQRRGDYAPMSA